MKSRATDDTSAKGATDSTLSAMPTLNPTGSVLSAESNAKSEAAAFDQQLAEEAKASSYDETQKAPSLTTTRRKRRRSSGDEDEGDEDTVPVPKKNHLLERLIDVLGDSDEDQPPADHCVHATPEEDRTMTPPLDRTGLRAGPSTRDRTVGERATPAPLEEMCVRLLWSRLHDLEALKEKLDNLAHAVALADSTRVEIQAQLDRDLRTTTLLAETCLAGRPEVRYRASFSEYFSSLIGYIVRLYTRAGDANE